jgi:phosphatidylglycerophosphate synthase
MQAVISIPELAGLVSEQQATELLMRPVAGVPLLIRSVLTVARAGASDVLLVVPAAMSTRLLQKLLETVSRQEVRVELIQISEFDPQRRSSWIILKRHLKDEFLWLPWNWITTKNFVSQLPLIDIGSVDWSKAAYATVHEVDREGASSALPTRSAGGVAVTSPESATRAERFLVAHSGKVTDGIHSSFNRRLCRPFVRMLSHTSVIPNAVTFGGIVVSLVAAIAFARGTYWWSMLGALLFYVAGLFDEMDGMLARLKFAESPRGTYLEGFADGLSYLLLFAGVTIGMYRHYGRVAIFMGIALLVGTILALITTTLQRKRATTPDRPNEYLGRFYQLLEKDSGNWISRIVRQVQGFQRRPLMIHYIVLFTILGLLPLVFFIATVGAHLTWILALYFNRRFFMRSRADVKPTVSKLKEAL